MAQKRLNALQGVKAKVSTDTTPQANSATAGRGENFLEKANALFDAGDFKEAANWYRQAAEQGDARAQTTLGGMYREGLGVTRDAREAVKWYRKAAEQGEATAQYNLGLAYLNGEGVSKDDTEGLRWLRKARDQGNADAKKELDRLGER